MWLAAAAQAAEPNPADTNPAHASFDRLSSPRTAQTPALATLAGAPELAPSPAQPGKGGAKTLGANAAPGHSFKGIPLGLLFTALVVVAYALRRCERVWPQQAGAQGAAKLGYLSTEAGRL